MPSIRSRPTVPGGCRISLSAVRVAPYIPAVPGSSVPDWMSLIAAPAAEPTKFDSSANNDLLPDLLNYIWTNLS